MKPVTRPKPSVSQQLGGAVIAPAPVVNTAGPKPTPKPVPPPPPGGSLTAPAPVVDTAGPKPTPKPVPPPPPGGSLTAPAPVKAGLEAESVDLEALKVLRVSSTICTPIVFEVAYGDLDFCLIRRSNC